MNKIVIILILLVALPAVAFGSNPAPYTDDALQNIFKAIADSPKEEPDKNISKEEFHKQSVEYFAKVFEKAGYSFNDTIIKIIDDIKNHPEAIPQGKQTVYSKVYMLLLLMMYQCNDDKVDFLQFFPPDTQQSIQWFMENSEFSKQEKNAHHGGRVGATKLKE